MVQRRRVALAALVLLISVGGPPIHQASKTSTGTLASQLSDADFWDLVVSFSEPNGYFRSDNFLSNERAYQRVLPELEATLPTGGVYLGVGPEQNFTYLAALRPKLAFIVDIRRGNLNEQLLYKAFFELSPDRAEFLSRLFARPKPSWLTAATPVDDLLAAYSDASPSEVLFDENLRAARDRLTLTHKFALTSDDIRGLEYVYSAFYKGGPELNYSFLNGGFGNGGRFGGSFFPTYAELMTETDGRGNKRSYLASDESYQIVRRLQMDNAIVPLVGDFGGPKALRSVGRYLTERGATVTAFYTSNVEQYLFESDAWKRFYRNVATLPVDTKSTFIRSISNRGFQLPSPTPGLRASTRLCSIDGLIKLFQGGAVTGYYDVIAMSR